MPEFSKRSLKRLETCDGRLQALFNLIVRYYDCTIVSGRRGKEEQNKLFKAGKSKVKYPNSKHNSCPSLAVDAAPYVKGRIPWNNPKYFYFFAGQVFILANRMNIPLRWGGDFNMNNDFDDQRFKDLAHYEILE